MGIFFQNLNNAYLQAGLTGSAYPTVVGMWLRLEAVGSAARTPWSWSRITATNHYLSLQMTTGELLQITARGGGTANVAPVATALVAGTWVFALARFISATDRRLAVRHANGLVEFASTATSIAPTSLDTQTIGLLHTSGGQTENWRGDLAEFWRTSGDIWPTSGDVTAAMVHQLAFGGPFSEPSIASKLVEYQSLRSATQAFAVTHVLGADDYFVGSPLTYINPNGVEIGAHPPLPYWYARPRQTRRPLVI